MFVYVLALSSKSRTRVEVLTRNGLLKASAAVIELNCTAVIPIPVYLAVATVVPAVGKSAVEPPVKRAADVALGQTIVATRTVQTPKLLVMRTPFVGIFPCGILVLKMQPAGLPALTQGSGFT